MEKLTTSSSTTTTSSSFLDSKRLEAEALVFKPSIASQNIAEQLKSSNSSLNVLESDFEGLNEPSMRYRIEQQRKGSIPFNTVKVGDESKVGETESGGESAR